jgi:hypothetical protein
MEIPVLRILGCKAILERDPTGYISILFIGFPGQQLQPLPSPSYCEVDYGDSHEKRLYTACTGILGNNIIY